MAGNTGNNSRKGAVTNRSQFYNEKTDTWMKRDQESGKIIKGKKDGKPFKGVTKENIKNR